MKFKLEIDLDNAAFDDPMELVRVLRKLADTYALWDGAQGKQQIAPIFDVNGNRVGEWSFRGTRK